MKKQVLYGVLCLFGGLFQNCQPDIPLDVTQAADSLPEVLDFNIHVKPILSDNCYFCHGPDQAKQKAGLRLDIAESAFATLEDSGNKAIVPGKTHKSALVNRILATNENERMPPLESNLALTAREKAILIRWIEEGAPYKPHWALIAPDNYAVPSVQYSDRVINPIDNFVFKQMEIQDLKPNPEADKETLLRRVSFDLTGLPPTIEELDAFLKSNDPLAYEKVVDRLLSSPHYGEKMASNWLDVSRYADTHGYSVDRYRPMWPWRDWVIDAFNENMPFNTFVTWQLAGDLYPNPSRSQLLATAFNRNHAQNMEGGIVNEEFRIEYVADRTNTFGKAFLATTLECARCHDHKFDPISQQEYFQLFSFFNNVDEAGQISWDDATPVPALLLTDNRQDSVIRYLKELSFSQSQKLDQVSEKPAHQKSTNQSTDGLLQKGLIAHFDFEHISNNQFHNRLAPQENALVHLPVPGNTKALVPDIVPGKMGNGFRSNGDDPLSLGSIGAFDRAQPFTISTWLKVPKDLENGVIFHKGVGAIIYNFRGFHLALRENKIEALMAHTWPYNAIIKVSEQPLPKDKWVHLTMSYDGSSKADGLRVYLNGQATPMQTEKDGLYKTIKFPSFPQEPGIKFGARWRGVGLRGADLDEIRIYDRELTAPEIGLLADDENTSDQQGLHQVLSMLTSPQYHQQLARLQELRQQLNAILDSIPEIMVMQEMEQPRETHILERGAYDAPGEVVEPGTPASILSFPDSLPKNRMGLAQWLFLPENPLTARVMVNRYWQSYFENGISKSAADFGNQGNLPSHPELLDWLAQYFLNSGWDIKGLHKMIVMSATYRQSSNATEEQVEKDYDNHFVSRGPSNRLNAEMLRDNALFVSGLMTIKIGGSSVKPYQPDGLWRIGGTSYKPDTGESLYRRSLYTFWKRTVPPPTMNTFDAPDRSYCVVTRQKTSTPLQSLVLLNDPQFIEASRALAARVIRDEPNTDLRITKLYRWLTSKYPPASEIQLLTELLNKLDQDFTEQPSKADGWLHTGAFQSGPDIEPRELATYTVLASTIMNSDAAIMKR